MTEQQADKIIELLRDARFLLWIIYTAVVVLGTIGLFVVAS